MSNKVTTNVLDNTYSELDRRIELIEKYNTKLSEEQRRINLNQTKRIREQKTEILKLKRNAISLCALSFVLVILFAIGLGILSNKHSKLSSSYNELSNQYIELAENYDRINAQLDLLLEEATSTNDEETDNLVEPNEDNPSDVEAEAPKEINVTDISHASNLSANDLNIIIDSEILASNFSNSKMEGMGDTLVKMEEEYDVNALFCLSVSYIESGFGTSNAAISKNNLFGLIASTGLMSFDTPEDCIMYWGKLLRNSYINNGRNTISSIQKIYCPNSTTWAPNITTYFNRYASFATAGG